MTKTIRILFVLLSLPFMIFAQAKIEFEKTSHDFGTIKEEQGKATVTFKFKNTGTEPLKLSNVRASCGCTTPEWSKEEVKAGESGFVKAVYNTANRPGKFNKSVTVQSNASNAATMILRINGQVTPRQKTIKDWYPSESGTMRMRSSYISFGDVMHDGKDTASTVLYNAGDKVITLDLQATKVPSYVQMKANKTSVSPKDTLRLDFTFDATVLNDWGYKFTNFNLVTNDSKEPNKRMNISARIKENFKEADKTNAPTVKFDKLTHNFGTIAQNDRVSTTFTISNNGKSPLIIRKTKASCGCTATKPKKTTLQAGESTSIDVTFSSGNREGTQKKSITVICNDPARPETRLYIEANVQKNVEREEKLELEGTEIKAGEKVTTVDIKAEEIKKTEEKVKVDLTRKTAVSEGTKNNLEQPAEKPKNKSDYQIGSRVHKKLDYKGKPVTITGFVEGQNGDKIQIRIVDTEGKKKLKMDGMQLKENLVIWDTFSNWDIKK